MDEATRTLIREQIARVMRLHECPNLDHPNHCLSCRESQEEQIDAVTEVFVTFTIFRELEQ
jgi:hypothetical protein